MTKKSPWDKENPEQAAKQEQVNDPVADMKAQAEQLPPLGGSIGFTEEDVRKAYKWGIDVGKQMAAIQYKKALKAVMDAVND